MSNREEIVEAVSKLGLLVDARDWDGLEELFCAQVDLDYTSLNGGDPQTLSPSDLIGAWRENLSPLQATHHLIGNHVVSVDGDEARAVTNVTGTHVAPSDTGGDTWVVGGRYDVLARRVDGAWRIAALKLTVRWASGNQAIMGGN